MMGRTQRIEGGALTYYINVMGKRDQIIFMDDLDRLNFINLLQQQKTKSKLTFYGYVLLPKQYSILMETSTNNLSKSMHRINSGYANYFNRRHKRKKKLFKDHYSCFIIEKKKYLAKLSLYLHLLPKKDGFTKSLFRYKWSSIPGYINKEKREGWIDYDSILNMFNKEGHKASFNYQKCLKMQLKKQIGSPFETLRESIILGSEDFKEEILKNQHLNKIVPQRNYGILAKEIIELATQSTYMSSLKIKKKKLNKTILLRNAAIYFLKKYTDLSNQQISTYFKSLKKSSISQMNRRFRQTIEKYKQIEQTIESLEKKINECILNKT